jgi:hypothetical protein
MPNKQTLILLLREVSALFRVTLGIYVVLWFPPFNLINLTKQLKDLQIIKS